ncbi:MULTISPECIES: hypothetical protein [Corallococcus]|uniref:hypothetical protein n=1 Tax=Corallococcus TaxID=83461 RepID=UPI00117EB747|nr:MULTISPECIES: hypothetical protein [Corallococcus]NBD08631.1 hypothetical protein [Corallococcus silvisoli]TSC32603.1 hypothetical protein FOF48_06215 [Corallococcus sp. Z5C101001]
MAPPKKEIPPLPPEPPELTAKREKLLVELDEQSKSATGTFQQVLRNMRKLVASSAPTAPLDQQLYTDVKDALTRFMKEPILPPPPILGQVVEYLQHRISTYGMTIQKAVMEMNPEIGAKLAITPPGAAAPTAAAPAASRPGPKGSSDGFESSSRGKMNLNPEPAGTPDPKAEQQQLESFKAWMKNPALGKLKG